MLLEYGHCEIDWQGEQYRLAPTFANIAKIGSPVEIIEDFKSFISTGSVMHKFNIALSVLNSCAEKPIPEALTGRYQFSNRQQKFLYVQPSHGLPMIEDVITLAEHCLIHGICGKSDGDSQDHGEPLTEFEAYHYMEMAMQYLEISRGEAADMTMTEFSRRIKLKHPPKKSDKPSLQEESDMLALFEAHNQAV